jgi:hypothetical protein
MTQTRERFLAPIEGVEWRESGAGDGQMTVAGHASVFNRLSLDLGGFREIIAPNAFSRPLDADPDVHLLWDHDTSLVLARTRNKTLDLRQDPLGLHFWGRVAPTSYAADLRVLMERGDVDQASFAFTVEEDSWDMDDDENVVRTVTQVGELYDVTITAKGAYPQTDASLRTLQEAISRQRIPGLTVERAQELARERDKIWLPDLSWADRAAPSRAGDEDAPPPVGDLEPADTADDTTPPQVDLDGDEERSAAPDTVDASEADTDSLSELKARTRGARDTANESYLRLLKEHGL